MHLLQQHHCIILSFRSVKIRFRFADSLNSFTFNVAIVTLLSIIYCKCWSLLPRRSVDGDLEIGCSLHLADDPGLEVTRTGLFFLLEAVGSWWFLGRRVFFSLLVGLILLIPCSVSFVVDASLVVSCSVVWTCGSTVVICRNGGNLSIVIISFTSVIVICMGQKATCIAVAALARLLEVGGISSSSTGDSLNSSASSSFGVACVVFLEVICAKRGLAFLHSADSSCPTWPQTLQ